MYPSIEFAKSQNKTRREKKSFLKKKMNEESRISRLGCNRFPNVSDQFPKTEWSLEHTSITEEWPKDRRFENFTLCQESAALYMLITEILSTYLYRGSFDKFIRHWDIEYRHWEAIDLVEFLSRSYNFTGTGYYHQKCCSASWRADVRQGFSAWGKVMSYRFPAKLVWWNLGNYMICNDKLRSPHRSN